jgi:ABC-2 type transport system permease protein
VRQGRDVSDARILDRGYRKYDGERSGVSGAVRSVAWHTTRSILGLGRKGRHKVFPIIVAIVAFVPATVFLSVTVLFGGIADDVRPEYWEFFGFAFMAALVFTAFVAPEAIVRDRRDGMFSLYLSTPLTKPTYLLAKGIAVVGTLWLIVGAPVIMAFIGYTSQGLGPDGFPAWLGVAFRLLLAGLFISVVYTAISLAASSLTDRRAFASVAVIMVLLGLSIAINVMVDEGGASQTLRMFEPLNVPAELAARMFGGRGEGYEDVSTMSVVAGNLIWLVGSCGVITARYRKLAAV